MHRYNELYDMVKQDRQSDYALAWEESFRNKIDTRNWNENINKRKQVSDDTDEIKNIKVSHDLWDDKPEELTCMVNNVGKHASADYRDDVDEDNCYLTSDPNHESEDHESESSDNCYE